jgi:hypothetical protein
MVSVVAPSGATVNTGMSCAWRRLITRCCVHGLPAACPIAPAIEDAGDVRIWKLPGEIADDVDHLAGGAPAMFAAPVARHPQAGVLAADPMDEYVEQLLGSWRHPDVVNHQPDHPLLDPRIGRRISPHRGELLR